ncbi:MAG: methyltransferase domain-containing protein [Candidatus Latescibacterota bacterium]
MKPAQQKWNAEDYRKNSSAQQKWAQELIAKLALNGGESVLDIGCGDGSISARLARAVGSGNVLGIDQSEDMIRHASEQYPSADYHNLSFLRMDARDIRLPARFDVAFSNAVLHWIKNQGAVLRGVRACLKSGGRILFQMGGRGNADELFCIVEEMLQHPRWRRFYENFTSPYHFHGPEEYETWLSESGFRPLRVELVPKDMEHEGTAGLTGWMRTTWFPYTDPLPAELRNIFLEEVIEAYTAAHPVDSLGNTHVKMVRLEVEACTL